MAEFLGFSLLKKVASVSGSPVFLSVSSGSYEVCTSQTRYIYMKVIFVLSLTVGQRGHNWKRNVSKDFYNIYLC